MAKQKRDEDLFDRLRSLGVRKGAARKVSESIRNSSRPGPTEAESRREEGSPDAGKEGRKTA
jgi:hypothetical protein